MLSRVIDINMDSLNLTQKMKRHAVLVAISAQHSDSGIASFLNVARSFVFKVRHEVEASGGDISSTGGSRGGGFRAMPSKAISALLVPPKTVKTISR